MDEWEDNKELGLSRIRVPSGWLVCSIQEFTHGLTYVPDIGHIWNWNKH